LFIESPRRKYAFVKDPSSMLLGLYCDSDPVRSGNGVVDEYLAVFVAYAEAVGSNKGLTRQRTNQAVD
jgi:hypothetical protein